jgi:hypothetical protein
MRGLASMVRRLVAAWSGSDRTGRAQGRAWYPEARRTVRAMATTHGTSPATAAGVVAALSPRLMWAVNVRAAETVLAGSTPRGVFRTSLGKAMRIRRGARPLSVLSGPKVRAFYRALTGDDGAAVVDVWVARVVGWTRELKERAYGTVARALEQAAALLGLRVTDLQATAWVAVRGRAA